ncbi:FAD-binding oxidoreductase [Legionella geestiana]|nr:FAD-binding oxidoreductase [Legionella geestiana]
MDWYLPATENWNWHSKGKKKMPQTLWNTLLRKQCEQEIGQALRTDEATLTSFSEDFGKLERNAPFAVCAPKTREGLQAFLAFAHTHAAPVTVRGNGLSQSGQSLPVKSGVTLSMENFNRVIDCDDNHIEVEANATWAQVVEASLNRGRRPLVIPYNLGLGAGGLLSAGGVGASAFRHGVISRHVERLDVVKADGEAVSLDADSPLFHAVLAGQGNFAVIERARLRLCAAKPYVRTFIFAFQDVASLFDAYERLRAHADYVEMFCAPTPFGTRITSKGRIPFTLWTYGMHITVEYDTTPPELCDLGSVSAEGLLHTQEESLLSWLHRYDGRYEAMRTSGQWNWCHPWYECFLPLAFVREELETLLEELPLHYANMVHVVPIDNRERAGFLMLPDAEEVCALMIMHPGISPELAPSCLEIITRLDEVLLPQGGKRYLSGFLGKALSPDYWSVHFGREYTRWVESKQLFDPKGILRSRLHAP